MKGDLQGTFRHGEDAPIVLVGVEAWLFNMAKMQCAMWDEEGHETGAIGEMATEAVWRRIPSNIIPPPDGSLLSSVHLLPATHAKRTLAQFALLQTTLLRETCTLRHPISEKTSWLLEHTSKRSW